jgi:hypothetical protein
MSLAVIVGAMLFGGCANESGVTVSSAATISGETITTAPEGQRFPEILDAEATPVANGTWTFAVTISSPYDTPQRYADAWRVLGTDGAEYGIRILAHDHAAEQPFTRSLAGVEIPDGVDQVEIEARDLVNGWSGTTFELTLPGN